MALERKVALVPNIGSPLMRGTPPRHAHESPARYGLGAAIVYWNEVRTFLKQ
jgi:hypothetical protein